MESIVKVEDFSFSYGDNRILERLNFEVKEEEIVGLLGINGSGKTTLLDSIYGLHGKKNEIKVVSTIPTLDNDIIKSNVSYIQDFPNILDYLTARQYLKFLCNIESIDIDEKKEELYNLIHIFGFENDFERKLLKDYSFGMKKKIQILSEIFLHKKLLIIDEPTNGLDVKMIISLKELIKLENKNHHTTIIISSHNTGFLHDVCNRVLLFNNKKIEKNIIIEDDLNLETEFLKSIKRS